VPSLAPELALLDRAQGLLASGRATAALGVLEEYDRTFPHGALAQEAEVLRIDALARAGQRSSAESRGRTFLSRHPESPQAARVRAALGSDGR
jgi:outer membrane protein assembly factor BamD (BamD/ComL family)